MLGFGIVFARDPSGGLDVNRQDWIYSHRPLDDSMLGFGIVFVRDPSGGLDVNCQDWIYSHRPLDDGTLKGFG